VLLHILYQYIVVISIYLKVNIKFLIMRAIISIVILFFLSSLVYSQTEKLDLLNQTSKSINSYIKSVNNYIKDYKSDYEF
jgi:cell shape-determining protein MreC